MRHIGQIQSEFLKEAREQPYRKITFEITGDASNEVLKLLKFLEHCGKIGHSLSLMEGVRKPGKQSFGFDGDGSARIKNISVE